MSAFATLRDRLLPLGGHLSARGRSLGVTAICLVVFALNIVLLPRYLAPHVMVEKIQSAPMPLTIRAFGFIDAKASITVHADFDGPILEKNFKEGDVVKKGQVLAVIGRDKIRLDYKAKQDALENAKSDWAQAKKDLRLQRALYAKQAVASSSVDDAKRTLVHAEQAVESASEAFRLTQETWDHNILTAPFNGTITKDSLNDDRTVAAARDIVTVSDVSEYSAVARVDELNSKRLSLGQEAEVRLPIFDNRSLKAVVTSVGSAQQNNGLTEVPVTLKLLDLQGLNLQPKLTAEVRIATGQTDPILSVPLTAIANADGFSKIWIVDTLHRLRAHTVTLGRSNPDRTEISQGAAAGERVCVNPDPSFADGMHVIVTPHANPS